MEYDYITTYTGVHFYPMNPKREDIHVEDIAHALSLICRGNGQVRTFYSVGEHCINCALEAEARGYSTKVILACLLHDACESYMSDVPRPFKKFLKDYIVLEDQMLCMVYEQLLGSELTGEEMDLVKKIDNDVLAYDLYYLLNEGSEENLPILKHPYDYGRKTFSEVEKEYLELYQRLKKLNN